MIAASDKKSIHHPEIIAGGKSMNRTLTIKGSDPALSILTHKYGFATSVVYGRIWRYSQMKDGVCKASIERIATELHCSRTTVHKAVNVLEGDGYIKDLTPHRKGKSHVYRVTNKINIRTEIAIEFGVQDEDMLPFESDMANVDDTIQDECDDVSLDNDMDDSIIYAGLELPGDNNDENGDNVVDMTCPDSEQVNPPVQKMNTTCPESEHLPVQNLNTKRVFKRVFKIFNAKKRKFEKSPSQPPLPSMPQPLERSLAGTPADVYVDYEGQELTEDDQAYFGETVSEVPITPACEKDHNIESQPSGSSGDDAAKEKQELKNEVDDFLAELDKRKQERQKERKITGLSSGDNKPPRTAEEARARSVAALERFCQKQDSAPQSIVKSDLTFVRDELKPLAATFVEKFGRGPLQSEKSRWLKEWATQKAIGLYPEDLLKAWDKMERDGLTVKSPGSLTAVAEDLKRKATNERRFGTSYHGASMVIVNGQITYPGG